MPQIADLHPYAVNLDELGPRALCSGADLCGCDLTGVDLEGLRARRVRFSSSVLTMANLRGADLTLASLNGARLEMAVLVGAELWGADGRGADFRSADLRSARCVGADFAGADLRDANLSGAWLHNVDLSCAQLRRASLSGACYSEGTHWPAGFDPRTRGAVLAPHWRAPVVRQQHQEAQSACERARREVERSRLLQEASEALCSQSTCLRWSIVARAYSRPKRGHAALLRLITRCAAGNWR